MSGADSDLAASYSPGNAVRNWLDASLDGAWTSATTSGFPVQWPSAAESSTGLQETSDDPHYHSWEQHHPSQTEHGLDNKQVCFMLELSSSQCRQ
jgi:hypothetical protein